MYFTLFSLSLGLTGGLQWLKESFEDTAQDLENDPTAEDVDGIPLVPVGEDADAAMESPIFQRLLQALGIVPPFDEQVYPLRRNDLYLWLMCI